MGRWHGRRARTHGEGPGPIAVGGGCGSGGGGCRPTLEHLERHSSSFRAFWLIPAHSGTGELEARVTGSLGGADLLSASLLERDWSTAGAAWTGSMGVPECWPLMSRWLVPVWPLITREETRMGRRAAPENPPSCPSCSEAALGPGDDVSGGWALLLLGSEVTCTPSSGSAGPPHVCYWALRSRAHRLHSRKRVQSLPGHFLFVSISIKKKKNQTPGLNWLLYFSIKAKGTI